MKAKLQCFLAAVAAVSLVAVSVGQAAEEISTREEYTARVEPICKRNVEANRRIFKGAKAEVRNGELKKASRHFTRAATAFRRTIGQLEQVPRPVADEAKLRNWLRLLRVESGYIARIGKALAAEKRHKAESISLELDRNSSRANNAALGFGFNYCLIKPSRFG